MFVVFDNEKMEQKAILQNDEVYMDYRIVHKYLNKRFLLGCDRAGVALCYAGRTYQCDTGYSVLSAGEGGADSRSRDRFGAGR